MRCAIVSDLHLEFCPPEQRRRRLERVLPREKIDVLLIAGDTIPLPWLADVLTLIDSIANAERIFAVLGNHELYYTSAIETAGWVQKINVLVPENVRLLHDDFVMIDDWIFAGTMGTMDPLFDPRLIENISDFQRIAGWSRKEIARRHQTTNKFLRSLRSFPEKKTLIMTHYLPTTRSLPPPLRSDPVLAQRLCSRFDNIIDTVEPQYWVSGHLHRPLDVVVGSTRVLTNPCGYPGERRVRPLFVELDNLNHLGQNDEGLKNHGKHGVLAAG